MQDLVRLFYLGRDKVRQYGYCLRGKPIKKQSLLVRGDRGGGIGPADPAAAGPIILVAKNITN